MPHTLISPTFSWDCPFKDCSVVIFVDFFKNQQKLLENDQCKYNYSLCTYFTSRSIHLECCLLTFPCCGFLCFHAVSTPTWNSNEAEAPAPDGSYLHPLHASKFFKISKFYGNQLLNCIFIFALLNVIWKRSFKPNFTLVHHFYVAPAPDKIFYSTPMPPASVLVPSLQ
jgi:hypothetical protein